MSSDPKCFGHYRKVGGRRPVVLGSSVGDGAIEPIRADVFTYPDDFGDDPSCPDCGEPSVGDACTCSFANAGYVVRAKRG